MRVLLLILSIWLGFVNNAVSQENPKVLLLPFQLNDLTDLANAPEELKRIELLSQTTRESLDKALINVVAIPERATKLMQDHSPTYLFDHEEIAAALGKEAGADYVIVCVALKPTYLFVYPRTLLIDVQTKKVVKAHAFQLESSWTDKNTTINTAKKIATSIENDLAQHKK